MQIVLFIMYMFMPVVNFFFYLKIYWINSRILVCLNLNQGKKNETGYHA